MLQQLYEKHAINNRKLEKKCISSAIALYNLIA